MNELTPVNHLYSIKGLKERLEIVKNTAQDQFHALTTLIAKEPDLVRLAQSLQFHPEKWLYIHPLCELYGDILEDILEISPEVGNRAVILIESTTRMLIIREKTHVIPIIFKNIGKTTRVYRVVVGRPSKWLLTLADTIDDVMRDATYAGGERIDLPNDEYIPNKTHMGIKPNPLAGVAPGTFPDYEPPALGHSGKWLRDG